MAQFSKGDTFVDGQQVTGARLNQLVDSAVLLIGAITEQTTMASNDVSSTDGLLINDNGVLKKTTVGDVLNSNLPVTTSSVTGGTGVDLVLTPAAGQKVDIAGNIEADDINATDDVSVGGDLTVTATLTVTGSSTLTGNVIADNGFTSNGTANFTGALQVNGTVGYVLTEVVEEDIPYAMGAAANTLHSLFTSASYTKPSDEIWAFEVEAVIFNGNNAVYTHYRITDSSDSAKYIKSYYYTPHSNGLEYVSHRFFIGTGTSYTGTFVIRAKSNQTNIKIMPTTTDLSAVYPDGAEGTVGKFRIFKYKTA
jgi:hypothetical protein